MPVIVPVIQYHMIDTPSPTSPVRGGFTPPDRFARQMTFLKSRGYAFYTAAELIEHFLNHGKFPPRGLAITFDDGCRDNYTNAFPVLRQLGIKATMFIVSSCIGQTSAIPLPAGEPPRPHLTPGDIREMHAFGIEFGSHSANHRLFHQISTQDIQYEVGTAKREIENLIQAPCRTFAYPAGFYTPQAKAILAGAGHICAFSTSLGPRDSLDLFAINRMEILRRDRFLFQFKSKIGALAIT